MKMYRNKKGIFIVLAVLVVIGTLVIPWRYSLVLSSPETDKVFAYVPMKKGGKYKMLYTHSIHLKPVIESYKILQNGNIRQYELEYEDFAIGMPQNALPGEKFVMEDGKYKILQMKRDFRSYNLSVGKVRANHTLIWRDKKYPLSRFVEPGSIVRFSVERISLIEMLEGVNIQNG